MQWAKLVSELIQEYEPQRILDLKARKWYFSILAASYGAKVDVLDDINNAEYNLGPAEKRLTIKAEENQQEENDGNNNQEQGEQKNENHQETGSVTEQKEENKKNTEVKESSNKDTSVSNKIIPKAGKTSIILVAIIVLVGVCIALAIKSKKINN